jgi:chitinase
LKFSSFLSSWEFPGIQGIGCNAVDPQDTNNFLAFLQELRATSMGKKLILSASVFDTPWVDATGSPSTNISAFSNVLDYISIMNYDVKSNPAAGAGPSSPLDYSCAPENARIGSAMSAVQTWSAAGMPAKQIVLGVPAYGHSFVLTSNPGPSSGSTQNITLSAYPKYNPSLEKRGDSWDGTGGLDICGVMQGPGGVFTYWGLMEQGFLNRDGSVADGIKYQFDNCSQTVRRL